MPVTTAPPEVPPSINLLLLVTGSVAAIKTGLLLDQLSTERCSIRIAATKSAFHFLHRAQSSKTGIPFQSILTDESEWSDWNEVSDAVVHIELRKWADLVVIVPLDANTLAKLAHGLCDNLVSCVMRAWQVREKPVIICPAMNTAMWEHPITSKQISELRNFLSIENSGAHDAATTAVTEGSDTLPQNLDSAMFQVVGPVVKRLACGDVGCGGMSSVEDIAVVLRHTMALIRAKKLADAVDASLNPEATTASS